MIPNKNSLPDFFIVGAAKSGTTSLAKYLGNHPEVHAPSIKEPRFMIRNILENISKDDPLRDHLFNTSVFDFNDYSKLYCSKNDLLSFDASVHYLYHYKEAAFNIKKYCGDVPIIIMLRNPKKRAISNISYLKEWHKNDDLILELEKERYMISSGFNSFWYYKNLGLYYEQVKYYLDNFSNVKIILFEDFKTNTSSVYKEVLDFLSLRNIENNSFKTFNASRESNGFIKVLKNIGLVNFIKSNIKFEYYRKLKNNNFSKLFFNYNVKSEIKSSEIFSDYFLQDIKKLELLIDKDLSKWY